ncbi:MAG: 4Fe-4S binding protein [Chloroflexi bacterium]|nr:4Fe-4S binding protein [Chloroflexota bacterium]
MELKDWRSLPIGSVVTQPGSSAETETGSWRTSRPVIDFSQCTHCMICWIFCPDSAFTVEKGKLTGVDYDHCKGCAICVVECPKKCIVMVDEPRL